MRTRLVLAIASLSALLLGGCEVGALEPIEDPPPEGPDAGIADPASLTGMVMDWSTGAPLANTQLSSSGLTPPVSATSDGTGAYSIQDVPMDTLFTLTASLDPATFFTTVSPRMVYQGTPMAHNVWVAARADVQRQYATVGLLMEPGTSFVEATLLKGDGTPRDGVLLEDVQLINALGEPVGEGPYFFGALGDIDPLLLVSTPFSGKARVAFLNVPPGPHTLSAIYPADGDGGGGGGGGGGPKTAIVDSLLDNVHLLNINDKLDGDSGGGGGM